MKAIFELGDDRGFEWTRDMITGRAWQCYREPTLFVQLGGNFEQPLVQIASRAITTPPVVANCFWNSQTISSGTTVKTKEEITHYLLHGRAELALKTGEKACPGCTFPRLMDDEPGTVLGLRPEILAVYLDLRDQLFSKLLGDPS